MKHEYKYAALAAAMMLAWGTAGAQTTTQTERSDDFSRSLSYEDYLKGKDLRASELVGARVRNPAGDNLGEIEEIVIPSSDQDDMLVIVSVGGVLDVGDKLVALPYDDLRVSLDGDTFYFDRTEEQLKAAPAFTYEAQAEVQTIDGTARHAAHAGRDRSSGYAIGRAQRRRAPRPPPSRLTWCSTCSTTALRTSSVRPCWTTAAKASRKVDDIVVSTEDDKLHAVLAIGGFVGFGAKLITIPLDDLQITSNDDSPQVRIAMTGEQLEQLVASRPEFRYERQVAQAPANTPRG